MMPKVLWETTLNPRTRRLLRVDIADQLVTDRVINELMGKDASARFRFIMERAEEAHESSTSEPAPVPGTAAVPHAQQHARCTGTCARRRMPSSMRSAWCTSS